MTEQEIRILIENGESEKLELKAAIPPPAEIAKHLASMANTDGGVLVLGVAEGGRAVGVNAQRAIAMLDAAQRYVSPSLALKIEIVTLEAHPVVLATVLKTGHLVSASGGYYGRIGDRVRPLTADEIRDRATVENNGQYALNELASAVATQTQTIEQLRKDFDQANAPSRKIGIAIIGALFGAVAKHLFDIYF